MFGNNCERASDAREACRLGETPELDGTLLCTLNFVDGVGDKGVTDEGFVCGIVKDDAVVVQGVINPSLQFVLCYNRSGGIVGVAEVYDVQFPVRNVSCETVSRIAGYKHYFPPCHCVGVQVNRVYGIGYSYYVFCRENIPNVAGIAFGSVADEYLRCLDSKAGVIVVHNGLAKEVITRFRAVTAECLAVAAFFHGLVHCLHYSRDKWLRDIPYTHPDYFCPGILPAEGGNP